MRRTELRTVLLVSTQRGWRGGEEQARQLALGLRAHGLHVHIAARAQAPFAERMSAEGFEVTTMPGSARRLRNVWRLRKAIRQLRPEVLHYNDPHALTAAGLASCGLGVPLRVMARRVDFPLSSAARYRWFADRVICVSQYVADVCEQGGLLRENLPVVYDGVDPQRMSGGDRQRGRSNLKVEDGQVMLLTVAAFSDHKGHRFLLDAMPSVLERFPHAALMLAGEGELETALREQTALLGIEDRVHFLGFRSDVADLVCAADLFVLPSKLEGLCSTLIDVMIAKTPIVATRAGGIPEVLVDEHRGEVAWLVPPEQPSALAAAIIEALGDRDGCERKCRQARERAFELFTADKMVEETIRVYEQGLQNNRDLVASEHATT